MVVSLGAFTLVRPVLNILGAMDGSKPAGPLAATVAITLDWVLVVVPARPPRPVVTLVLAGATYAVLAIALRGIHSPILEGELQGPLANPAGIVGVVAVNAVWGLLAGLLAAAALRISGRARTG